MLITEAVLYCQRVAEMGMPVSAYTKALREPVYFLWEAYGRTKAAAAEFRSKAAAGLRHGANEIEYDHAVPFGRLQAELLALRPATTDAVAGILRKFSLRVLITKAEHRRLGELKLGRAMPADWDEIDPFARYRSAGIELEPNTAFKAN